jgi:hypothetical protein
MKIAASEQKQSASQTCTRRDSRDLLEVLKSELAFLEGGGYAHPEHAQWRPRFFLEDSSSCPNYLAQGDPVPCSACVLLELVPENCREKKFPCRLIPLNADGETLDSYYRCGTEEEAQVALAIWLRKSIAALEYQRKVGTCSRSASAVSG